MMGLMRWISGLAGGVLLVMTFASVLRTMVVPRGMHSMLVSRLWQMIRGLLRLLVAPFPGYPSRDRVLAWLAPLVLVAMLGSWLGGMFVGYGLIMHAISGLPFGVSFREAGSSLFTLGYASTDRLQLSALDFLAAASGPLVIALQIAYLPTLYGAYNRRETEVTLLQSRAGEPAWGPELLARQVMVGTESALPELYRAWERLAAEIGESHANYQVLLSFRSPQPLRSWIVGLISVMDAAAIQLAVSPRSAPPEARLVLRASFTALRDIARVIGIPFDADPDPDGPIQLSYEEFLGAVAMIGASGFHLERKAAEAWPQFRGWRINYETIAYELCRRGDAVPALWTGPRDFPAVPIPPNRPTDRRPLTR
jgi:hypothetical protein